VSKKKNIQWIVYVSDGDDHMTRSVTYAHHIMLPQGSERKHAVDAVRWQIDNVYKDEQYKDRELRAFMVSTINHGHEYE
jgi:hypothetical protein